MFWETIGIDSKDMAKSSRNSIQNYPRVDDFLDDSKLVSHPSKIGERELVKLIKQAIQDANNKSSRESLQLPPNATDEELNKICKREGINLFKYFKKYCGDPAATAHQVQGKHFRDVGREQFRNRSLQKERMNSGWRYQFLALICARQSKRFNTISDLNSAEADFNAVIAFLDKKEQPLSLYVSVKNRVNTMGGQDWPKAIQALEKVAQADKNRRGAYCCVFGIAMDRGTRQIKKTARQANHIPIILKFGYPIISGHSSPIEPIRK